jgi:hypothetical protein
MGTVVIRNRDKQEFQKCKGCHFYISKSEKTAECDICGEEVRHTPMEYHVQHSAPRGKQESCLRWYERGEEETSLRRMYGRGEEEREKAKSVATDTVNEEREASGGRERSQEPPPPPPMAMLKQLPSGKPKDKGGNRGAKSKHVGVMLDPAEVATEGDAHKLDSLRYRAEAEGDDDKNGQGSDGKDARGYDDSTKSWEV